MDKRRIEQDTSAANKKFNSTVFQNLIKTSFETPYPNPFFIKENAELVIPFMKYDWESVQAFVLTQTGRSLITLDSPVLYGDRMAFFWDGKDRNGNWVPSGIYIILISGE